jgi:hypothetical protein
MVAAGAHGDQGDAVVSARDRKVAKARELREEGLIYEAIGERLGIHPSTAQKWCKPEAAKRWARAWNAKANTYKRQQEAKPCPRCGGRRTDKRLLLCADCKRSDRKERGRKTAEKFIALRKHGLLNYEIAELENTTTPAVAQAFQRASRVSH